MEPFQIRVSDDVLDDLRSRLQRSRFTSGLEGEAWSLGTDPQYLKTLVGYWLEGFDWRSVEAALNRIPQFTATIHGSRVHFARLGGTGTGDSIPIILSHGWPYSFVEMLDLARCLSDPLANGGDQQDLFEVIIPSLPGYGFSDPLTGPFLSSSVAAIWHELMTGVLGYRRYATYGEDVGAPISDRLGALFPDHVIGLYASHLPMSSKHLPDDLDARESAFAEWLRNKWNGETGYAVMQATKPNTLAVGLGDSPVGLLAWIVEKLRTWSGSAEFERFWTADEILTLVTLYWVTGTIGSSFRPYVDSRLEPPPGVVEVPVGVSVQLGERGFPRSFAERTYRDIRFWNDLTEGAHFTAKQAPSVLAADMRTFFRAMR